jgi:hypothetical protein
MNAARAGDAETVAGHVWEALRFNVSGVSPA